MKLVQLNPVFDPLLETPERLLDTYHTLTGWSDALTGAGVSVVVVQAYATSARVQRHGVDYLFCPTGESGPDSLVKAVAESSPDIVHINGFDRPQMTSAVRRELADRIPLVMQHHGGLPPRRWSKAGIAVRRAMAMADAFLFTSRAQADPWIERGYVGDANTVHEVLEASTDMGPVDRLQAREMTGVRGSPAVLWVGRLDANKDPLTMLRGFELASHRLPEATLTMVYSADDLLEQVRSVIDTSDRLHTRVRLVGAARYQEMPAWYSASDLFVLGSHHEGSGYALLEACACGVTPVVTDIAPFRAITGNGSIGRHWPVGDSEACGAALVAMAGLADDSRRAVLDRFRRALSWEAVGTHARAAYDAAIARRAGGG